MFPANDNGEKIPVKLVDGTVIGHVNRIIIDTGLVTCEIWVNDYEGMNLLASAPIEQASIGPITAPDYLRDPH